MPLRSFYLVIILVAAVAMASISFSAKVKSRTEATEEVGRLYSKELKRFDSCLKNYTKFFYDSSYDSRLAAYQQLFYQFKQIECLFTYLHPKEAYETFLVTPRFQQRDFGLPFPDNWLWVGPFGIEHDSTLRKRTLKDTAFTQSFLKRAVNNFQQTLVTTDLQTANFAFTDIDVFHALRLQMARISTIGLANGDMVIEHAGMPGLQGAIHSWANIVRIYAEVLPAASSSFRRQLLNNLGKAEAVLDAKPEFKTFDRMNFLTGYLLPLSHDLNALQRLLDIPFKNQPAAFNVQAASIYDKQVFNTDYFTPSSASHLDKAKAALGKLLFFDPILSDNNQRACASCHKPEMAFADGNKTSVGFEREKDLMRNAPTVINAVFQKQQFWDLRAGSLEDQLDSVVNNKDELHSSFETVIEKINSSETYKQLFYEAFPGTKSQGIQRSHVKIAIASYERELTGLNSRFDNYVRGDKSMLTATEIDGFNVFMGKGKCGACHFAPLFNGALPPYFDSTEHRAIGVPLKDTMEIFKIDPDTGFSKIRQNAFNHFSFKVPTLRNVELTAPYMHNGVYRTLEQVIDFYDHAGGVKFTKDMRPGLKGLPFFMILPEKLNLTQTEKSALIHFLKALTDTSSSRNIPDRLPALGGKYARLNNRQLGGEY